MNGFLLIKYGYPLSMCGNALWIWITSLTVWKTRPNMRICFPSGKVSLFLSISILALIAVVKVYEYIFSSLGGVILVFDHCSEYIWIQEVLIQESDTQGAPPNAYFWSSDFQNSFWFWKFRKIHDVWLRAFFDKCLLRPLKLLPHFLGKISPLS